MATERFAIVATQLPDDCFSRFSETANRDAIDAGTADPDDPYSWIEASFEIHLVRLGERTFCASMQPSQWREWLQNYFVGEPNPAWLYDGDPDGLEMESGGEFGSYFDYQDRFDPRFVCETFTFNGCEVTGLRKNQPGYHEAVWQAAREAADYAIANGADGAAQILNARTFRRYVKERQERERHAALPFAGAPLGSAQP